MKIYKDIEDIEKDKYTIFKMIFYVFIFIIVATFLRIIRNNWPKALTTKVENKFFIWYMLPLIGTIIFGFIDSLFFFMFEDEYLHYLAQYTGDIITASLLLGGISSFVAIYFGRNMHHIIELITIQKLEPSPLQEGFGILIGTFIVIIGYMIYKRWKKKSNASRLDI